MLFQPILISLVPLLPAQYVFVVMAVLVLEAGVGALARLYEEQVGPELKMNLNRTFLDYYSVRKRETIAINQMQKEVSNEPDIRAGGIPPFLNSDPYARPFVPGGIVVEQLRAK